MSRQFNRRGPASSLGQPFQKVDHKPFCKVCCDAGKCKEEFTSHNVRDDQGKVICLTLLNQQCRYCFNPGHTVKFCPVLKEREQEKEKYAKECVRLENRKVQVPKAETKKKSAPVVSPSRSGSGFAALAEDSDSEDDEQKSEKEAVAYIKGKAYFDRVEIGLTQEFPGYARFLRANGQSIALNPTSPAPKTMEEEYPSLNNNVTLRPHQKSFAAEGSSFAAKLMAPAPTAQQRDAWSDDDEAPVMTRAPVPSKPFKKIEKWADYETDDE
jgi:hypothetical protein